MFKIKTREVSTDISESEETLDCVKVFDPEGKMIAEFDKIDGFNSDESYYLGPKEENREIYCVFQDHCLYVSEDNDSFDPIASFSEGEIHTITVDPLLGFKKGKLLGKYDGYDAQTAVELVNKFNNDGEDSFGLFESITSPSKRKINLKTYLMSFIMALLGIGIAAVPFRILPEIMPFLISVAIFIAMCVTYKSKSNAWLSNNTWALLLKIIFVTFISSTIMQQNIYYLDELTILSMIIVICSCIIAIDNYDSPDITTALFKNKLLFVSIFIFSYYIVLSMISVLDTQVDVLFSIIFVSLAILFLIVFVSYRINHPRYILNEIAIFDEHRTERGYKSKCMLLLAIVIFVLSGVYLFMCPQLYLPFIK